MSKSILIDYFEKERKQILDECTQCGLCYQHCSLNEHIIKDVSPSEAQDSVLSFLREGTEENVVYERAFSCLQCFKCVNTCPKGLNPLRINELIKWDYRRKGIKNIQYTHSGDKESPQRILSSIQLRKEEHKKITAKTEKKKTKYVFFPGCNVYFQPEKVLSALDILDLMTDDCAFLPGLDYCCGSEQLFYGDVEQAQKVMEELVTQLSSYQPETVILWCPTCLCNFDTTIAKAIDLPFKVVSFSQFVAQNMDKLEFKKPINKNITLHEACKSAFTGLDMNGTRDILKSLPGVNLVEMKRHGESTVCCGLGAQDYSNEIMEFMRDDRLKEADETNAEILVDVCHACHKHFVGMEQEYSYQIINYVSLLAQALGIERKDKLKEYIQLNDLNRILDDAAINISESPYSSEKIEKAIRDNILS